MLEKSNSHNCAYTIECHDVAQVVEFCPYEWSSQLIAVGTSTRVTIGTCRFQEELPDIDGIEYTHLRDFHHGPRVTALSWSPETSLLMIPKVIRFATGGSDNKLRIFSSELKTNDNVKVVEGHTDYINDVTFDPDKGEHVASVSDDHTCRVWDIDGSQKACFPLSSPGMSVKWHSEDPLKIMIGEKRGMISFINIVTQQPILSLDCGHAPLLSADWCHGNVLRIAAVAGTHWFIFDTSRSSRSIDSQQAHSEGGREVRWSRSHDHLLATLGSPGSQFRIMNGKTNQVLIATDMPIANGISWHARLPLVAVGGDRKVHFWPTESV